MNVVGIWGRDSVSIPIRCGCKYPSAAARHLKLDLEMTKVCYIFLLFHFFFYSLLPGYHNKWIVEEVARFV